MVYPSCLLDLEKGANIHGDDNSDPKVLPQNWIFNENKYNNGRLLLIKYPISFILAWHCSIVIGFSVPSFLHALISTSNSDTPKKSHLR